MTYCKDALKYYKKEIKCGKDCPIFRNCPRLIMEDGTDILISKAIEAMFEALNRRKEK